MKTRIAGVLCLLAVMAVVASAEPPKKRNRKVVIPAATRQAAHAHAATGCDASLWEHVYHKQRLVVVERCVSVTGVIKHKKPEADGDEHIQMLLDPSDDALLNDRNRTSQHGALVVEPVCQRAVTQPDAIAACRDFHSDVDIPTQKKARVTVLGAYVLDKEANHGWMEIHPVTSITVVQ